MLYEIGFKNGNKIRIDATGEDIVTSVKIAIEQNPHATIAWYCEANLFMNISEIQYVMPVNALRTI